MKQIYMDKTSLLEQRKDKTPNRALFPLIFPFDRSENSLLHSKPRNNVQANMTSNKENSLHCKKSQEEVFRCFMFL